jgi:hypothetical protein
MKKLAPIIILLSCVVEAGLQPKKDWNFMQSASRGIGPASRCKANLSIVWVIQNEPTTNLYKARFLCSINEKYAHIGHFPISQVPGYRGNPRSHLANEKAPETFLFLHFPWTGPSKALWVSWLPINFLDGWCSSPQGQPTLAPHPMRKALNLSLRFWTFGASSWNNTPHGLGILANSFTKAHLPLGQMLSHRGSTPSRTQPHKITYNTIKGTLF